MSALSGGWAAEFPELSPAQLFTVAADIENYPRFIPWCLAARVRWRGDGVLEVDNHFGAGPIAARFRSHATLAPPSRLEITSRDGPFRSFHLEWRFLPLDGQGCRVDVTYAVDLHSPLLRALASLSMPEVERRVVKRFKERARMLYGGSS